MRSNPLIKKVVEAGEAQVDRLVGQLLGNERFVAAVQGVVSRTMAAKGSLDKSIKSGLATMNLPSTEDIDDLRRRLDELDRSMVELDAKLTKVEKAAAVKPKAPAASRATKPKAAGGAKPKPKAAAKKAAPKKTPPKTEG